MYKILKTNSFLTTSGSVLLAALFLAACTSSEKKKQRFYFTCLSSSATGIDFQNTITESDSLNLLVNEYTYMGSGVGIGDFNNDGLQDVFFAAGQQSSKLFLNKGEMHFEDITEKAGVKTTAACTGVNVVDINQDGWLDIYVCVSGPVPSARRKNLLFINQHDLTFKEEADAYHLADTAYCTQAVFFDYDKDGDLDMYLLNHRLQGDVRNEIRPKILDGTSLLSDALYRNDGVPAGLDHPVYTNVTKKAGIIDDGYGLGIAVSDLNNDGYPDIYIANDYIGNDDLWMNNKDGTFTNCISTSLRHQSYSSMGTDIADFNNDGLPDIATLDMQPETNERKKMMYSFLTDVRYKLERDAGYDPSFMRNTLQLNNGVRTIKQKKEPFFSDIGQLAGMAETDWSWSVLMADFDNDGWKDIHITNGMGRDLINADFAQYRAAFSIGSDDPTGAKAKRKLMADLAALGTVPLRNYLYHNKGDLTFEDVTTATGITEKTISNGAAFADLDNDGDLDMVINNINSEATVMKNELNDGHNETTGAHYITLSLQGDSTNLQAIGAKIVVHTNNEQQFFEQYPARGYLSSVDQRIHIGIGKQSPDSIVIIWPDSKIQTIAHPPMDTMLVIHKAKDIAINSVTGIDSSGMYFNDITATLNLPYKHTETFFYDYGFQSLIPQKYSQEGPFISTGDINGDGLQDFFVGGAYNQSGKIFLQQANGNFIGKDLTTGEKDEEDMQSLLFDADGDKDLDLLVVSGSSEYDAASPYYRPRLYINDGKGNYSLDVKALPPSVSSPSKCIAGADFDGDGDVDLFIGGRVVVGAYPQPPRSFLLRNDQGKFTDITPPVLQYPGLLNAACWADIDHDHVPELIIAGDWMPIRIFKTINGSLNEITAASGTKDLGGFWRSLIADDIDNDGDVDLIVGNLGMNNSFHINQQRPAKLVARDFDGNGVPEPVFCYFIRDEKGGYTESVGITRDQWAAQAPSIKKKFIRNQLFADATMDQIITPDDMNQAIVLTCNEERSGYFENMGNGNFIFHTFPVQAQIAPVNSIQVADVDNDGKKDILLAGNEYQYNVAAGRMDASYGLLLKGDGKGRFTPVPPAKSGWITDGDVKDIKLSDNKKWGRILLIARNDEALQVVRLGVYQ